jgi:putative ABC transport system permease protein
MKPRLLQYYFMLGLAGLQRNRLLTALMVLAIGLGIGSFMSIFNLYHMMSSDPIPHKSSQLYNLRLDISLPTTEQWWSRFQLPPMMTFRDSKALLDAAAAPRQTAQVATNMIVDAGRSDVRPASFVVRMAGGDFFNMFSVPFLHGNGWSSAQEQAAERVVVISREVSQRFFGETDTVGRTLELNGEPYSIVGVIDRWQPLPRFYDMVSNPYGDSEEIFIPFSLVEVLEPGVYGSVSCDQAADPGFAGLMRSECVWTMYWLELPDRRAREDFETYLQAYIAGEQAGGRMPRSAEYALENVREWMKTRDTVGGEMPQLLAVSFLFLIVCLINSVGLLLAKFLSRSGELGIRRALGADRIDVFAQHLAESGLLGVAGGVLGVAMTWLGLRAINVMISDLSRMAVMQWEIVLLTVIAAVLAAVLTGLYPAWRAAHIPPAAQIRSQ